MSTYLIVMFGLAFSNAGMIVLLRASVWTLLPPLPYVPQNVRVTFLPDAAAVVAGAADEGAEDEGAEDDGAEDEPAAAEEPAAGAAADEPAAVVAAALLLELELLPQAEVRATVPTAARVSRRVVRLADEARIELSFLGSRQSCGVELAVEGRKAGLGG
jgi:hypothetical protein